MNEFDLIKHFFCPLQSANINSVCCGIGDDAAEIIPDRSNLLISTDTFNQDVHFASEWPAEAIGYRCLVAAASDIIAMAGVPEWYLCALSMLEATCEFLTPFTSGLMKASRKLGIQLVGGDMTRHCSTSINITCLGSVEEGSPVYRDGAMVGDGIFLSGDLGRVKYALDSLTDFDITHPMFDKLLYPPIRLTYVPVLRQFATASVDISDGFSSDLGHILKASGVGADIMMDNLPICNSLREVLPEEEMYDFFLSSGDEFELLFTVPQADIDLFNTNCLEQNITVYHIGNIVEEQGIRLYRDNKLVLNDLIPKGYLHF